MGKGDPAAVRTMLTLSRKLNKKRTARTGRILVSNFQRTFLRIAASSASDIEDSRSTSEVL